MNPVLLFLFLFVVGCILGVMLLRRNSPPKTRGKLPPVYFQPDYPSMRHDPSTSSAQKRLQQTWWKEPDSTYEPPPPIIVTLPKDTKGSEPLDAALLLGAAAVWYVAMHPVWTAIVTAVHDFDALLAQAAVLVGR